MFKSEECPKADAADWYNKLNEVRQGIVSRSSVLEKGGEKEEEEVEISSEDEPMEEDKEEEKQEEVTMEKQEPPTPLKHEAISFYEKHKTLNEIVGDDGINNIEAGGKDPHRMGFREQFEFFDALHNHAKETGFIPQIGHESSADQTGMDRYYNWTTEMSYGKPIPFGGIVGLIMQH